MTSLLHVAGLEVEVTGRRDGPLLLLTRMASRGSGIWDPFRDQMAAFVRLACFDLPMPKRSALSAPRSLFADFASRCVRIADELEASRFHILGWDGGTQVALQCAHTYPERTAGVVLVAPSYPLADMRAIDKATDILVTILKAGSPELYSHHWFMGGLSERFVAENYEAVAELVARRCAGDPFLSVDPSHVHDWVRIQRRQWLSDAELAAIRCRTLIVSPGNDYWRVGPTPRMAELLHARMPGSRLITIPHTGHLCLIENPDPVCNEIRSMLDSE